MSDANADAAAETQWPAAWTTLPHGISVGRYIDPAFARLEHAKLWCRVWQAAARLDEIPQSGDYTTYEISDQSVLLVRVDQATVKAFHNVCPRCATALGQEPGTFHGGRIICFFHGWRWDLQGRNQFVPERQGFRDGHQCESDVALKQVNVELFAGFVFINLERDPEPFEQFISPVRELLEGFVTADMHHYWWKSISIPANWKVAQEAFFETYHVPATHPQLDKGGSAVIYGDQPDADFNHRNVFYETFPHGHGRFYGGRKTPMAGYIQHQTGDPVDAMAARMNLIVEGMDAQVLREDVDVLLSLKGKPIPPESSLGAEYRKALYERAAEQQRPMPRPTPEILGMWGGEVFIFPNLMILPQGGNTMMYRVRPDGFDPDRCTFEIFSTKTYPAPVQLQRATVQLVTDFNDPEQLLLIPRQDLGNIPRIQKGLHSRGIRHTWLAAEHEKLILNMHQELDRYLRAS